MLNLHISFCKSDTFRFAGFKIAEKIADNYKKYFPMQNERIGSI